jgi:hypothetical protein
VSAVDATLPPFTSLALRRLRDALDAAGYAESGVASALGTDGVPMARRADLPLYRHRLEAGGRLADLIDLFLLGGSLPPARVAAALAPLDPQLLVDAGLLERSGADLAATARITPWNDQLYLHDPDEPGELRDDFVTGVNPASRTLANLTVRRPAARALDLGTGCGVQAFRAAQHADHVVATDLNPRALRYVALNAALNRTDTVEGRQGSLFEPVAGETFDLIVTNPPYVISPDMQFVFRDGGGTGDAFCRGVVADAPAHLREGGFATILCNWVVPDGRDAAEVLAGWVSGSGCDACVLHYGTQDPLAYAHQWNAPQQTVDPAAYAAALDRWLTYYRTNGVDAIASGALVLRRRSGANWVRAAEMPLGTTGQASDHLLRLFEAADHLSTLADERTLLTERFRLVEPHLLDQQMIFRGGGYQPGAAVLTLEQGVGLRPSVDPAMLPLLFGLDGQLTLGELIAALAEDAETPPGQLEPAALKTVATLYQLGFLTRGASRP